MPHSLRLVRPSPPPLRPGTHSAIIPRRILHYLPAARERWRSIRAAWEASAHQDWSVWEEFEPLARTERFVFAHRKNPSPYHFFGEALIARELEAQRFTCWATCRLLRKRGLHSVYARQTAIVEQLLADAGLPRPRDYLRRLSFSPQHPDLTAFHPDLGWRFVEVKVNGFRSRSASPSRA